MNGQRKTTGDKIAGATDSALVVQKSPLTAVKGR
jgi:hypothetical protein